jgi:hypothetical protein
MLTPPPPGLTELRAVAATDLPDELFQELRDGDVLFIDTTHTVKFGSEVNRLVLEVIPRLAPGVLVHFHDIFIPWEYPRRWLTEHAYYWAEQYLVHAFLCENPNWEILVAAHHLHRTHGDRLRGIVPELSRDPSSGALWIRRR